MPIGTLIDSRMAKKRGKRSKAKVDTSRTGKLPWTEPAAVIEDDATPSPVAMSIGEARDDTGAGENGAGAVAETKDAAEPASDPPSPSPEAPPPGATDSKDPAVEAAEPGDERRSRSLEAPPAEAAAEAKEPAAPEPRADEAARAEEPAAAVGEAEPGEEPAGSRAESRRPEARPADAGSAGPRKKARGKGKKERTGDAPSARERTSGDLDHAFFRAEDRVSHTGLDDEEHDPLHARAADPGFAARRAQLRRVVMIAVAAAGLLSFVRISGFLPAPPPPARAALPGALGAAFVGAAPRELGNARQAAPAAPDASGHAPAAPTASAAATPAAPAPGP